MPETDTIEISELINALRQKKIIVIQMEDGTWISADEIKKIILPDGTVEMI